MRLLRDVLVAAVIATSLIYLLLPTRLSNSIQKTTTTPPPHASVLDSFGPNQAPPASPVSYNNDALLQPSPPDRNLGLLSMLVKDAIANNAAATSVAVNVSTIGKDLSRA